MIRICQCKQSYQVIRHYYLHLVLRWQDLCFEANYLLLYDICKVLFWVFRKPTNTDLYIHWQSFSPLQWKHRKFENFENFSLPLLYSLLRWETSSFRTKVSPESFSSKKCLPTLVHQYAFLNDVRKQTLLLPYAGQNRSTLMTSLKNI